MPIARVQIESTQQLYLKTDCFWVFAGKNSAFCLENSGITGHSCGIVRAKLHWARAISSIIRR